MGPSSPTPTLPYKSVDSCIKDLLLFTDTLLAKCVRVNTDTLSAGVNTLTVLYNLLDCDAASDAYFKEKGATEGLSRVLVKYLPDHSVAGVSTADQLDLATLIMGIFSRLLSDTDVKRIKQREAMMGVLLQQGIASAMTSICHYCSDLQEPDLIVFTTAVISALAHCTAVKEAFTQPTNSNAVISALANILVAPIAAEAGSKPLNIQMLQLLQTVRSMSSAVLPVDAVALLQSYRAVSPLAGDAGVREVLDALFVVAVPVPCK